MREIRRIVYLFIALVVICAWCSETQAQAQQPNVNLLLRKSAVAYQELDTYQDVAVMQFEFGGEGMGQMNDMMSQMGDMMKMQMDFAYQNPKNVKMDIQHSMYSGTTIVDGSTVVQYIGSMMGQPLNQYVEKPLEDGDIIKALKSMSEMGGQSGDNMGIVYTMMVSDNPLASFSETIKAVTYEGEGTVQYQAGENQNEMKEVHILGGEMDAAALGMPGLDATAKIYMDKINHLIYKVDTFIDFDMAEAMKNVPENMRGNAPAGKMKITATMDHTRIKVNEPIPEDIFVFTPPEGATKAEKFDMQAIMQNMGAGMPGMQSPGTQKTDTQISGVVGEEANKSTLKSIDGKLVNIPGEQGDVVVLYFFASWSGSCKRQTTLVEKLAEEMKEQGVVIYGLNNERNEANVQKYVEENNITFPVLMDDNKANFKHYDVTTLPAFVLIDSSGTVVQKLSGMQTEANLKQAIEQAGK